MIEVSLQIKTQLYEITEVIRQAVVLMNEEVGVGRQVGIIESNTVETDHQVDIMAEGTVIYRPPVN